MLYGPVPEPDLDPDPIYNVMKGKKIKNERPTF
jgi:hypothetical protein